MMSITEKEKMIAGDLYDASDEELARDRTRTRMLLSSFNNSSEEDLPGRWDILKQFIPNAGKGLYIQPPFYCDYGYHILTGEKVYFNFNCVILDVTKVTIGDRTMFGPAVQIYTATHPVDAGDRASGLEYAKPIEIGSDVWVGGNTVICPGVRIGDRTIIGAGSVVTKDIPADVIAAGNPCRIIRSLLPGQAVQVNPPPGL